MNWRVDVNERWMESFSSALTVDELLEIRATIDSWAETGPPQDCEIDRKLGEQVIYRFALPNGIVIKFFVYELGLGQGVIDVSLVLMKDYHAA